MLEASYCLFQTIGLSKKEIIKEIGEENRQAIIAAGILAMSITHDNCISEPSTRSMTGNLYIDCALSAIGLDIATGIRTALEHGVSKKVAKQLIKSALKASLGTTAGITITVALWGLCVGGIG